MVTGFLETSLLEIGRDNSKTSLKYAGAERFGLYRSRQGYICKEIVIDQYL